MAEVRVDIVSDFKERGFKRAQSATDKLEKSFKRLGKQIASVFAVRQLVRFTKESALAFAAEDKAIRSLSYSLQNLGLAFEGANIEKFLSQTERTTSVAAGELRPAFQQLVGATLDVGKAQELLNLALNIAAGTGKDLTSVSNALSKAYLNDVSALGKLNVGLTGAQLKTMTFAQVQEELNQKFSGQAVKQAETYAGKISALDNAFTKAQETIGEKFIRALENMAEGDFDKVLDAIAVAADKVGNAFIRISYTQRALKAALTGNISQIGKLQEQMNLELLGGFSVTARPVAGTLNKEMAAQRKLLAAQEAARKKALAAEKKAEAERLARKRAGTIFDIENIQVVAALQGKIDGEERARLVALLALQTENYTAAEKLADIVIRLNKPALENLGVMVEAGDTIDNVVQKLIMSQAKLAGLQLMAEDFPELDNPFDEWNDTLDEILAKILAMLELLAGGNVAAGDKIKSIKRPTQPLFGAGSGASDVEWMRLMDAMAKAGVPYVSDNQSSLNSPANMLASARYAAMQQSVNVYVSGNVTSERDLVDTITEQIYNQQKSGKQIVYSSTGL